MSENPYANMHQPMTRKHWNILEIKRRAGVVTPLFSLYSQNSVGIGELTDLSLLGQWCEKTGISIIQLLPLNDVGFNFTPYDAKSSFALEPMYLSLNDLAGVDGKVYGEEMNALRKKYPAGKRHVDYGIKQAKLSLLKKMFNARDWEKNKSFKSYRKKQDFWLKDYALFTVLKEIHQGKAWWEWPEPLKQKQEKACHAFVSEHGKDIAFQEWLQWQLFEQGRRQKEILRSMGVFLMGDLPFLVSKDSADVWAHQNYFKLELSSGAPPDMYFADGQRWGMPPYDWEKIAGHEYDYIRQKLDYAENFYDLYRIDHFVGIFRLWTIPNEGHMPGAFDPPEEHLWEEHGKRILNVMLGSTTMLPCAEDLGTVPDCSYKVLREYGIVGMDVIRWQKDWNHSQEYTPCEHYRPNSIAAVSTHDTIDLRGWWNYETGTVDEATFHQKCHGRGLDGDALVDRLFDRSQSKDGRLRWRADVTSVEKVLAVLQRPEDQVHDFISLYRESFDERVKYLKFIGMEGDRLTSFSPELAKKALSKASESVSIFSVQLLQDWLALSDVYQDIDALECRINKPGSVSEKNWSVVIPVSLEQLLKLPMNATILELNKNSGRL